jgi:hypothetical protein
MDNAATQAEFNRPINKSAKALVSAMSKAGAASPYLGIQLRLGPNEQGYTKFGFPYFDGAPPDALFVQIGVKPHSFELLILQAQQRAAEAKRAAAKQ